MVKVTGTLQKSADIMKASNSLMNVPQLSGTMREMSAEMMKAGIMSEMMDDTLEALDDDEEELEEEAQEEVDKVLWQITDGKLGQANGQVGNLPVRRVDFLNVRLADSPLHLPANNGADSGGAGARRRDGAGDPGSLVELVVLTHLSLYLDTVSFPASSFSRCIFVVVVQIWFDSTL